MSKNVDSKEKKELISPLFSSSNWLYSIIFEPNERKSQNSLKLLNLKNKIYKLELDIKSHLFSFSRLIEEGMWDAVFTYLIILLNDCIYTVEEVENKEQKWGFKNNCFKIFFLDTKLRKQVINQIIKTNGLDLKEFDFSNFVNSLSEKSKMTFSYLGKYSKEFDKKFKRNILKLLLSCPWYKDYLGFIWPFFKTNKGIGWKFQSKTILKLFLLDDLNIFVEIDKFIDQYGGWKGLEFEENLLKLLEILGFIFNKIKSNSLFGEIKLILKELTINNKIVKDRILKCFQKGLKKLSFPEKSLFLKQNVTSEEFENIICYSNNVRNFASHTQNTEKFTKNIKNNSKTPIECMLYILDKIDPLDAKTLLDFRFPLKNYLDQIYNFNKKGELDDIFKYYSGENVLEKIKKHFFGENSSKNPLLNLNQEEQIEYDKKYRQNKQTNSIDSLKENKNSMWFS